MAHVTGGGLPGNVNRALGDDVDAKIDAGSWEVPPIFGFLQGNGNVDDDEMMRVFNMGVGYVLIVRPTFANSIHEQLNPLFRIEHVCLVKSLPRTASNKVMRRTLRNQVDQST